MPLLERLLALRFGWILIRLGVAVCLLLSSVSSNAAGILSEDSESGLEDSELEKENEKESEPELAAQSVVSPPPRGLGPPKAVRLEGTPSRELSVAARRGLMKRARAPPAP